MPLSQLRYGPHDEPVWSMHAWRWIDRLQEESQWNLIPRQGTGRLYNFGELHGIRGLTPRRRVELLPHVLAQVQSLPAEAGNPYVGSAAGTGAVGIDAKIGLTSNFTLDAATQGRRRPRGHPAVGMPKPILIGSSCGGDILHTLGAQHPDRLGGLVYLDAAEDPTLTLADYDLPPVDMANLPARAGKPAPVSLPEGERRQMAERPLDTGIRKAIVEDHRVRPDYARIRVPVLSICRTETMEQTLAEYLPATDQQRAAVRQLHAARRARLAKWQRDLLTGVPSARIVELPGASLYMFVPNEADVLREVRAFAATLPP